MPCIPMVKKGDSVVIGQKIGDCKDNNDSSVHSSVCGEVLSIEMAPNPDGNKALSVIIKTIESDETVEFSPTKNPSQNDLIELIKNSGIVEHYGLPTQSVLNPDGKKINTVLIIPHLLNGSGVSSALQKNMVLRCWKLSNFSCSRRS